MSLENISGVQGLFKHIFAKHVAPGVHRVSEPRANKSASFLDVLPGAKTSTRRLPGHGASPSLLENVMAAANPEKLQSARQQLQDLGNVAHGTFRKVEGKDPMIALEGTLLSRFVNEMLPKADSKLYGEGVAGDTWRGFEVDQFAQALANSDPLKLASKAENAGNDDAGFNLFGSSFSTRNSGRAITPFST